MWKYRSLLLKRRHRTVLCLLVISILTMFINNGCDSRDPGSKSVSGSGFYFDTVVSFTVYGTQSNAIINELMDECAGYEKIFSATDSESELYKLNHGETSEVSKDLYQCISRALEYCRLLDGRYDISIRPVSELWNFQNGENKIPSNNEIEEALKNVDYKSIRLLGRVGDNNLNGGDSSQEGKDEADNDRYRIEIPEGMMIDLGSAAKGYIGDRLCEYLKSKGYRSAVLSLGGNVQCLGEKPAGKTTDDNGYFKIAIKSPFEDDSSNSGYAAVMKVKNRAVVTSGIYERSFEKDGILYHHILDTKTGFPIETDLVSVTILCNSGIDADILSTACFIAGYEDTLEILKMSSEIDTVGGFEAEFIYKDGSVKLTNGFEDYID
ncbi:MAG: FAD:protein FMN transferase [Lachnospiraceae bacterium]|nr:FAD:protein FMN transferase [Lachnospiraceae bacterium]